MIPSDLLNNKDLIRIPFDFSNPDKICTIPAKCMIVGRMEDALFIKPMKEESVNDTALQNLPEDLR